MTLRLCVAAAAWWSAAGFVVPPAKRAVGWRGLARVSVSTETEAEETTPMEDRNVPEGHKGLHESLYGDGDAHTATLEVEEPKDLDGAESLALEQFWDRYGDAKFAGVYAVEDVAGRVVYVGLSRHVVLALRHHRDVLGADDTTAVAVRYVRFPKRDTMERMRLSWIEELDYTPEGNLPGPQAEKWASNVKEASVSMRGVEAAGFEDRKAKLETAMAVGGATAASSDANMRSAVEEGDWSSVIAAQDEATVPIQSPFAKQGGAAGAAAPTLELTRDNVEEILNEVRPFLLADGGNVAIVEVNPADGGTIALRLEGACGTCPSATVTMQMGIERRLKEVWPGLKAVENVTAPDPNNWFQGAAPGGAPPPPPELTMAAVQEALAPIVPAVENMGGVVEVLEVNADSGAVSLRYNGPPRIAYGIELSLKDLPLVKEVTFTE